MSRRGHGEGAVYRRAGDGRWVAVLDLGIVDGRRKRRVLYGLTRREVVGKLAEAGLAQRQGVLYTGRRQTTGQFLEYWLEHVARPSVRFSTYRGYRDRVRNHVIPALGHVPLERLTRQQVQKFIADKTRTELSPQTIAHVRNTLRTALNHAIREGLIAVNPAGMVTMPRITKKPTTILNPEQARALLAAAQGNRHHALYATVLAVGLRRGEALGLRWDDVDLQAGMLHVNYTLQRIEGRLTMVEPKTARSRRTLRLPGSAVTALREHRRQQLLERLRAGARWQGTGLVFTTVIGTGLVGEDVSRAFHRLLVKAGLPPIRFHDLRHSCASLLLAQGVPLRTVMEVLGHSSITMTANTYAHLLPNLLEDAAQAMDRIMAGPAL